MYGSGTLLPGERRMVNLVQCLLFEALETSSQGVHSFSVLDSCIHHVSLSVSELRHSGSMSCELRHSGSMRSFLGLSSLSYVFSSPWRHPVC